MIEFQYTLTIIKNKMKKTLSIILITSLFFSCKKDEDNNGINRF